MSKNKTVKSTPLPSEKGKQPITVKIENGFKWYVIPFICRVVVVFLAASGLYHTMQSVNNLDEYLRGLASAIVVLGLCGGFYLESKRVK